MADNNNEEAADKQIAALQQDKSELTQPEIKQEIIQPNPENTDMEVHHHAHPAHGKKSWKSYFWEFLMLFLAVFCGFLAENQREHMIEHQREKQYAQTLVEDLTNDLVELNGDIPNWEEMIDQIETVRNEIEKGPLERNSLLLYRNAALLITNNNFFYHDRTIGQLKNAGNFRLIRIKSVADSLILYDAIIISGMKDLETRYNVIYFQNREVLQEQLFNTKFFSLRHNPAQLDSAAKKEPGILEIRKGKEDILFQYYNSLFALEFQTKVRVRLLKELLRRATNLLELIKKEYEIE